MVCSCGFFFEQCAGQAPAQTALPARYAAKQQRPCQGLVIVFIEESLLLRPMLRRPAGQATSFRLKFYAAGARRELGGAFRPPRRAPSAAQGWVADAARPARSAPYRR